MTAQTVKAREAGMMDSLYGMSKSSAKKASETGGFQDFMNQSLDSGKKSGVKHSDLSDHIAPSKNSRLDDRVSEPAKKIPMSNNDNTTSSVNQSEYNKTIEEQVSALEAKLKDIVKEVLGITDEELEEAMSVLGLNMMQLLQPDALKDLALYVNGESDISAVLTNEELAADIANLLQKVGDIDFNELGINPDDLDLILQQYEQNLLKTQQGLTEDSSTVTDAESEESVIAEAKDGIVHLDDDLSEEALNQMKQISNMETDESDTTVENRQVEVHVMRESDSSNKANTESESSAGQKQNTDSSATNNNNADTIINNMAQSQVQNMDDFVEQTMKANQVRDIVNQVVDQIKVTIKPTTTSMELQLNPENLGKVNLTVMAKDGVLTAQFVTQNQVAKEALEGQLHMLKETFTQQNIKVEAIEVTVSPNFEFNQSGQAEKENQEQKGTKRNLRLDELDDMDGFSLEETLAADIMIQNGNSLDYSV